MLPNPVLAATDWSKYQNSPVVSSVNTQWYHTQNPTILQNTNNYLMLLEVNDGIGGGWRISKGVSQNGINWTVDTQPIIQTGQWDNQHSNPTIIYNPILNQFQGWFTAYNSSNWEAGPDRYRMGYITSSTGLNWLKYNENWVLTGSSDKWDKGGIARGLSVLFINGIYHLWYTATNDKSLVTAPSWQIGYATSSSGLVWTKHPGNPVITKTTDREFNNMMYPFVLYENGKFKMWYGNGSADHCTQYLYAESTNGYEWTKPANKNPVYTVTGVNGDYDKSRLAGLSIVRDENTYKIWYSGFDGSHWSIGYATSPADPITITPTPTPIEPVVIVPGTMASWNKEGILEGQPNPTTDWKILPFVKEYDGLVQTLKKLGYEEGKNLFLWPYDWRKSVDTSSQQLNTFIETKVKPNNVGSKIHLVGHSLGGLVTRAWTQTNSNVNQVHHLVTVATPHKGTIQPYKAWEGGDVAQENSFLSLATRIMIELNRRAFTTTRQAVQIQFPVLKDLLPTESYLKRQINGSFVDQNGMAVKNTWLSNLNTSASSVFPVLDTIRGVGFPQTPYTYTIVAASWLDRVLGNWQDGKPVDQEYADGDALVTSSRADFGDRSVFLSQNHSNVIADSSGVKQILQTLEIPATDANIVSGAQTTIQPGLLFLLRSPATLQVTYNDQTHTDFDGIIFIPNASNGTYEATVTGTSPGTYRLVVAQFSDGSYSWKEYVGNTVYGKKTKYTIPFSQTEPKEDPAINLTDKERLEEIDLMLLDLSKLTKNLSIPKARFNLKIALSALSKKDYYTVKRQLEQILLDLSWFRKSNPAEAARLKSFAVSDTLIDAYQAIFSQKKHIIDEGSLKRLQAFCNYEEVLLNKILEAKSKSGKNITLKVQLFNEGKTYKARAEKTTADEKAKKYILLFQTQLLFREIGL